MPRLVQVAALRWIPIVLLAGLSACGSPPSPPGTRSAGAPADPAAAGVETRKPSADEAKRAIYVAGLSFVLPAQARVDYPQGIDSSVMIITGPGYDLFFDDYGSFNGTPDGQVGGAPAVLSERSSGACRFRHWEVKLPATNPTMLICEKDGNNCRPSTAHANISSYCTSPAACGQVDSIIASATFSPSPWPRMPAPDAQFRPRDPVCRVD